MDDGGGLVAAEGTRPKMRDWFTMKTKSTVQQKSEKLLMFLIDLFFQRCVLLLQFSGQDSDF